MVSAAKKGRGASRRLRPVSRRMYSRIVLERPDLGPAQFEGAARRVGAGDRRGRWPRPRRRPRPAGTSSRRRRSGAGPGHMVAMEAKRFRKPSPFPNTIEGRRMTASGLTARTAASASPLERAYSPVGTADRRRWPRSGPGGRRRRRRRPRRCCGEPSTCIGLEAATGRFEQDADQVHGGVRALQGGGDVGGAGDVAADGLDLAHVAEDAQVLGQGGIAHRDADAPAAAGQGADGLGSDEAGAAEDGDQAGGGFGHRAFLERRRESPRGPCDGAGIDDARRPRNAGAGRKLRETAENRVDPLRALP